MTPRERVRTVLEFSEADIVPYNVWLTISAREKLAAYYGDADVEKRLGNHIAMVGAERPMREIRPGFFRDEFGVVWDRTVDKDIGTPDGAILPEPSIRGYRFPDPDDPERYEELRRMVETDKDKYLIFGVSFSLFERVWTMRGMADLLTDMIENPQFVDDLLDAITEYNLSLISHALEFPIDAVMFGDDWGSQRGLLTGIVHWRRFIKPRLQRMYGCVKDAGRRVFIHSCGRVQELFDDLIEIGLDCFNPFQPEVMDVFEMKRRYQGRLSFYGGISVQKVLPFGTPDEVRSTVQRLLREVGKGGGYIACPSHSVPKDVPVENIVAMLEVLQQQGR